MAQPSNRVEGPSSDASIKRFFIPNAEPVKGGTEDDFLKRLGALTTRLENQERETSFQKLETERIQGDIKEQKNYLLLGFFVLIMMVITLIVMVLLEWTKATHHLIEKVESMETNMNVTVR